MYFFVFLFISCYFAKTVGFSTLLFCDQNCACLKDSVYCYNLPSLSEIYYSSSSHLSDLYILNESDIDIYFSNKPIFNQLFQKIHLPIKVEKTVTLSTIGYTEIDESSDNNFTFVSSKAVTNLETFIYKIYFISSLTILCSIILILVTGFKHTCCFTRKLVSKKLNNEIN